MGSSTSDNLMGLHGLLVYMQMMFVPHRKQTYGPPRPGTGRALLFYMQMIFVPRRKYTYGTPRPVQRIVSLFYMQMMSVPHRKQIWPLGLLKG
jgi:hypothetical protein